MYYPKKTPQIAPIFLSCTDLSSFYTLLLSSINHPSFYCQQFLAGRFHHLVPCHRNTSTMEFSFVAQDPNLYLSNEEKTLRIIQYIQSLRISFRDFLVVAFLSDDTTIEAYVNKFYGNDGPQAIPKCWDRLFYSHKRGYNGSFQAAIIDAVIRRSKRDLRRITKAGAFRCPSNKVTRDYFDTFSLRTIESELERYAPCLTKVLRGLQGTRLSHQGVFVPVMGAMVCYNHSNKSNTLQLKMGNVQTAHFVDHTLLTIYLTNQK